MNRGAVPLAAAATGLLATLFMASSALGGGGCHGSGLRDAKGTSGDLVEICFDPMVIRVDPGQRVTWTNRESIAHTVTGPAGLWGSVGQLADGESVSQVFDIPGIYPY